MFSERFDIAPPLLIVSTSPPRDENPNADQCTAVLVDGLTLPWPWSWTVPRECRAELLEVYGNKLERNSMIILMQG